MTSAHRGISFFLLVLFTLLAIVPSAYATSVNYSVTLQPSDFSLAFNEKFGPSDDQPPLWANYMRLTTSLPSFTASGGDTVNLRITAENSQFVISPPTTFAYLEFLFGLIPLAGGGGALVPVVTTFVDAINLKSIIDDPNASYIAALRQQDNADPVALVYEIFLTTPEFGQPGEIEALPAGFRGLSTSFVLPNSFPAGAIFAFSDLWFGAGYVGLAEPPDTPLVSVTNISEPPALTLLTFGLVAVVATSLLGARKNKRTPCVPWRGKSQNELAALKV